MPRSRPWRCGRLIFLEPVDMHLMGKRVIFLTGLMLVGCVVVEPGTMTDRGGWVIQRAFLPHRQNPSKTIEVFWATPAGQGP
jgi:hypothetical protein